MYEISSVNDVEFLKQSNLNLMLSIVASNCNDSKASKAIIKVERKDDLMRLWKLFLNIALR